MPNNPQSENKNKKFALPDLSDIEALNNAYEQRTQMEKPDVVRGEDDSRTQERRDRPRVDDSSAQRRQSRPRVEDLPTTPVTKNQEDDFNEKEFLNPTRRQGSAGKKPNSKNNKRLPKNHVNDEDEWVDYKNKKIVPTGGKHSKIKLSASDLDKRNDRLKQLKMIRMFIYTAVIIVVLLGLKNTFFPQKSFTYNEIEKIISYNVQDFGFPIKMGEGFAIEFVRSYIEFDKNDENSSKNIAFFYGIKDTTIRNLPNAPRGDKAKMTIISGPTVFESKQYHPESASYKLTTLVSYEDSFSKKLRWINLMVNVYYNSSTGELALDASSPTLLPTIMSTNRIPQEEIIGNGKVLMEPEFLYPAINGYVQAFLNVSFYDHAAIDQYIPSDPDIHLYSGFAGEYALKQYGGVDNTIRKTVYYTDNPNEWKVDVSVTLIDKRIPQDDVEVTFPARYVATIVKTQDNKYLVIKFTPYIYTPKPKN